MALSASSILQVWNGGLDDVTVTGDASGNGGGFDPNGCTFDNTASVASANTNAPVVTITNYTFVAGDVGAWFYAASGTSLVPGFYPIASVAAGLATLNATLGAAQLLTKGLNTAANVAPVAGTPYGGGLAVTASTLSTISWSIDYSRQTSSQFTYTDLVVGAGAAQVTSVAHPFGFNTIGNILAQSRTGGGWNQIRCVVQSITTSIIANLSNSPGFTPASTAGTGKLGGAFASAGMAGSYHVGGAGIYAKYNATAFSSTSTTSNIKLGRLTLAAGTSTAMSFIRGFDTVCGDEYTPTNGLNRPTLKWGNAVAAGSNALITAATTFMRVENIICDGNTGSATNSRGVVINGNCIVRKVKFVNFNSAAFSVGGTAGISSIIDCEASGNVSVQVFGLTTGVYNFKGCSFHDNTFGVIQATTGTVRLENCNFYNNTGASTYNVQITGAGAVYSNNVTMGTVGQHGFDIQAALLQGVFTNTYIQGAGGWGWNFGTAMDTVTMINCCCYNNTSGNFDVTKLTNSYDQIGFLLPTGDVFTNLAGGDLTLNNTSGAGAVLRAAGWPSTYPGMTGTNYSDVGAYQHADPAGAAGMLYIPNMDGI